MFRPDENPLCGQCLKDYYEFQGTCVYCPSADGGVIFGLVIVGLLFVFALHIFTQNAATGNIAVALYCVHMVYLFTATDLAGSASWLRIFNMSFLQVGGGGVCVGPMSPESLITLGMFPSQSSERDGSY